MDEVADVVRDGVVTEKGAAFEDEAAAQVVIDEVLEAADAAKAAAAEEKADAIDGSGADTEDAEKVVVVGV